MKTVREDFPVTRRYTYLNTGFFGPISKPVTEAVKTYLDECCTKGMGSYEVFAKALKERERARKELASLLNARTEEIAIRAVQSRRKAIHLYFVTDISDGVHPD
jgi:selenocysteine lyase/cysteine desulfurase